SRKHVLADIQSLLDRHRAIEDVRFGLTSAAIPTLMSRWPASIDARFKMSLVGRNREGRRQWISGTGTLAVARSDSGQVVRALAFDEMTSLESKIDLFVEVGA